MLDIPARQVFNSAAGMNLFFASHNFYILAVSEPPGTTAHPRLDQATRGGTALAGQSDAQKWHEVREF